MSDKEETRVKWLPLESNPEVINKYVQNIGVNTDMFEFTDIYGLDSELLAMVPRPCVAVLLLFPVTKLYQEYRKAQIEAGQNGVHPNVYFTKQTVSNACGTVALIHALANNKEILNIDFDKTFGQFLRNTEEMTPDQRAEFLKADDSMTSAHSESANEGQTQAPSIDEELELHFIAYIQKDGILYELDGAKDFPISHGEATAENFLEKSAEVVRKLVALNPDENRFNLIALAAKEQ